MRYVQLVTCICCLALIAPGQGTAQVDDLGSRVESFRAEVGAIANTSADDDDWQDHRDELEAAYERWFPEGSLEHLVESAKKPELADLFFATLDYAMDVDRKSAQRKAEAVFSGLEAKGWADDRLIGYMHRFLLTFRRFDEAKAFRLAHPQRGLPAPPPVVSLSGTPGDNVRTVLRFINDGSTLKEETVDWQSSARVFVVGHPGCRFSRNAVAAIAADPELAKAMNTAAIWLTAPFTSLTDGPVLAWNREHPDYAYRYVESVTDWPEINYWGTPSFYFMKDGRLVKKLVGWPEGGRRDDLQAGLRAIGVASSEPVF